MTGTLPWCSVPVIRFELLTGRFSMPWLHHYTRLLAAASLLLITAGGLVTSTGSGLSVPDWPNSYGYFMFSFPLSKMVGGIFYEHAHRLIASIVGLLTIGLAVWISRIDSRRWVRRLGWTALASVIMQGTLGGLTVIYFLPPSISISHAGLAQLFFALIVSLAIFTSKGWHSRYNQRPPLNDWILGRLALITPTLIYVQILVGATMRHTDAGLAIPDFPLVFGGLFPSVWTPGVSIHFAHRIGALLVAIVVCATAGHVLYHHAARRELCRPALLLSGLILLQIALGGWTILSEKHVTVNTAHVAVGALAWVTAVSLALRVHREWFVNNEQPQRRDTRVGAVPASSEAKA